jgi:hypothetical protein
MGSNGWSLEVVRGREAGRVYPLGRGATVLGNALNGVPGLDLAPHEGDSPRRMAARQAQLDLTPQGLTLRDLDSPGGTFVNRQRLLPGQARALQPGDLIQLGGVQLKVVPAAPSTSRPAPATTTTTAKTRPAAPRPSAAPASKPTPPPPASPSTSTIPAGTVAAAGSFPTAFTLATGARCRTWDDFLTVAAQRWGALRDELVSGRLAAFLNTIGRGDLAPSPLAPGTPDERLDAWLGTLPTSRPSRPELDVHPEVLTFRAVPGGGMMRASLQIANTGYRLLRTSVRVEPASATWIRLPESLARGPIVTVDQTALPIEVSIPETFDATPGAVLVLDSNGGTRRVEVRLERPAATVAIPDISEAPAGPAGLSLRELIARQPVGLRLITWGVGAVLLRVLVLAAGLVFGTATDGVHPPLQPVSVLLAALGCVAAAWFALRHGEPRDVPAAGFAGGVAGVLAAAVLVATCRTIEPRLLPSASPLAACLLWGILGAGLAVISTLLAPPRSIAEGSS